MSKSLQPLLADNKVHITEEILPQLQYPLFSSPKLDGLRLRIDPVLGAVSRSHKPLPNRYLQEVLREHAWLNYLDGEAIVGEPTAADVFNKTQSAIMSQDGTFDFTYHVFDSWHRVNMPYVDRLLSVKERMPLYNTSCRFGVQMVPQALCASPADVLKQEEWALGLGYEGLILRSTHGRYKNGRSTFKEGILLKLKRKQDAEAVVVGFEPLYRNTNEAKPDNFGFARRSSHQAGKVADDLLGKLLVEDATYGQFAIGTGFDDATRAEIWHNQDRYINQRVSYTFQPAGMKDKPRFPSFKGFRHD